MIRSFLPALLLLLFVGFIFQNSTTSAQAATCPTYKNTVPASGTDHTGASTIIVMNPVVGASATTYFVSEKQKPSSSEYIRLTETSSGWTANTGKITSGSHTFFVFDSLQSISQGQPCQNFTFSMTRTDAPTPQTSNTNNTGGNSNNSAGNSDAKQVRTAIGVIPTDPQGLANTILRFALGIAGGIAFLLIVMGGFKLVFSQGNPENVQAGKELITSAIVGLLIIIFSTFILRLVGIDILGLPL